MDLLKGNSIFRERSDKLQLYLGICTCDKALAFCLGNIVGR